MKSVFKAVAPVAMTLTFALSGGAMADTAIEATKSADTATSTVKESVKPVAHKEHNAKQHEQNLKSETGAAAVAEKSGAEKTTTEKSTTVATVDKTMTKPEPSKREVGKKAEVNSKATETTKTEK